MTIGLVLPSGPGYTETFFRSKIKGLQASGHKMILFCTNNPENFDACPIFLLPKHFKSPIGQFFFMTWEYLKLIPHFKTIRRYVALEQKDGTSWSRILKRIYNNAPMFRSDLDWLHFGFGTLVLDCQNVAAANNSKMGVSFRGFDIGVYPIKHPKCYQNLWDKVSKIHVISDDIAQLVYKNGFNGQVPMVKITPAINSTYFTPSERTHDAHPITMLTVARLHWKKGLDYTLEALAILKQKDISFEYRIIGAGPEEEALKFAVSQLGLQDQVLFLGKLKPEEVKQQMAQGQIYIQYSVQEGFCNAVLEAQAMGLLCVVSDAEGLSENIIHEVTGFVIPKRSPEKLASTIENLLYLPTDQKKRILQVARERIQNEFNLEKQKREFGDFYELK